MTTVIVVQHGEKERRPGDPGLTADGRQQASVTATWLKDNVAVRAVWSSPLRRAAETAQQIAAAVGLEVQLDGRLVERMNWEGPASQSIESFMSEWDQTTRQRGFIPSVGDSSYAAARRFEEFLDQRKDERDVVVAVAHGGVTVDLLRTLIGDQDLEAARPGIIRLGVDSCAMTRLGYDGHGWVPQLIGWTGHLPSVAPHRPA
jgi:broad specificity phosphatase PhoE